jgi:hypothetical protein
VLAVNAATNAALAGRRDEAEARLEKASGRLGLGYLARVVDVSRASLAMSRGDLTAADRHATAAIERPLGVVGRAQGRVHVTEARALRALVRASRSDVAGARADIEAVRASRQAAPGALARATLAEAVLLERGADRGALRDHLHRERTLLMEHTVPRERALVRAYRRMLRTRATTVYRNASPREEAATAESSVSSWIAKVAPDAAAFVPADRPLDDAAETAAIDAASSTHTGPRAEPLRHIASVKHAGGARARTGRRVALVWVSLILVFLAIWQFLAPDGPPSSAPSPTPSPSADLLAWLLPALLCVVLVGVVVAFVARARRRARELERALVSAALGDAAAQKELERLADSSVPLVATRALLSCATEAERRGDLHVALSLCDRGLAKAETIRVLAFDVLLPGLAAERALVLAALGHGVDALAEIDALATTYPSYALLDVARARVSLVERARRGDLRGAARGIEGREDLPIPLRDELLGRVAKAASAPGSLGAAEMEHLDEELREDETSRRWIAAVAPAALDAWARARRARDDADDAAVGDAEAEAEREADAEAEAAEARAGAQKARQEES